MTYFSVIVLDITSTEQFLDYIKLPYRISVSQHAICVIFHVQKVFHTKCMLMIYIHTNIFYT